MYIYINGALLTYKCRRRKKVATSYRIVAGKRDEATPMAMHSSKSDISWVILENSVNNLENGGIKNLGETEIANR